jgi:hypothetical protein
MTYSPKCPSFSSLKIYVPKIRLHQFLPYIHINHAAEKYLHLLEQFLGHDKAGFNP